MRGTRRANSLIPILSGDAALNNVERFDNESNLDPDHN
jgi:hypothetical protein